MTGLYSDRVELALNTVFEAHGIRQRKAGRGFEASHVISVALIASDFDFDEDIIIGALLHDTLEDTDLQQEIISARFGDYVLRLVQDVTEPPRPNAWQERKLVYLKQLETTPRDGARAIAAADKIHNLSRMLVGIKADGQEFLNAFSAGLNDMRWYQQAVYDTLCARWTHPILEVHHRQLSKFLSTTAELTVSQ